MIVVALGHTAQVGKDEIGKILVRKYGFTRLAFADELKRIALKVDPIMPGPFWDPVNLNLSAWVEHYGWEWTKTSVAGARPFLQNLGVVFREETHEDFWINRLLEHMEDDGKYVITDVRFPNEMSRLNRLHHWSRGNYVKTVKVTRPGFGEGDSHISETSLATAKWDAVIDNDGTLEDLETKVDAFMKRYFNHTYQQALAG